MVEKMVSEIPERQTVESVSKQIQNAELLRPMQFADLIIRYINIALGKSDLSRLQGITLHNLVLSGGTTTPTELSKMMYRSKHGLTKIVDDLEKKGQVIRKHSLKDRRSINISITSNGIDSVKRDLDEGKVWLEKAMDCLNDDERTSFTNISERVYTNIKTIIDTMSYTKID